MKKVILIQNLTNVNALNLLRYTYADMGKHLDEAEELSRRAMRLQPDDGYVLDNVVGYCLTWLHGRGAAVFEKAYRLRPEESIIAEHLGDALCFRN